MLRLILFTMAALSLVVAPATIAWADVTIHVEDFENEQGEPAFDPLFVHEFSRENGEPYWGLYEDSYCPEQGTVLGLWGGTQDAISFNLASEQTVVYTSVDVRIWDHPSNNNYYSIDFVGSSGTQRIFLSQTDGFETIGISSNEIGAITEIQMRSGEGYFDNITIHVIPEPSTAVLGLIGFVVSSAALLRRSRRACK